MNATHRNPIHRLSTHRRLTPRHASVLWGLGLALFALAASPAGAPAAEAAEPAAAPDWRPVELGDGWPISTPEEQGLDSAVMERMMEVAATDPRLDTIHSLLLIRHGTLVGEAYFHGRRPEETGEIRSATKSFTSLLVGIAMDQGLLGSVDQPLFELLPGAADLLAEPAKRQLTLSHALTMRLGLRWEENSPGFTWSEWPPDLVRFTLEQPVAEAPGTRFRYSSGTTQLLAAAVTQAAGRDLHGFAEEHLFAPLGIEGTHWMHHSDGSHYGGVGLFIRPRDMAKIGQLALQEGRWETAPGELSQIVSQDWIRRSTRDHVGESLPYLGGYGYQWWADPEDGNFAAIGHGGQWIAVFPEQDGVLVITAEPTVGVNDSIDVAPLEPFLELLTLPENPGRLSFPMSRFSAVEGQATVSVPVRRLAGSDGAAKVVYEVTGGSARPGEDFQPVTGVLSWNHGDSAPRRIEVPLIDDGETEGEETFEVRLSRLTGGVTLGRAAAIVAIADDDPPPVSRPGRLRCGQGIYPVREGETATVQVERLDGADGEVSVRWTTADRSAAAGSDYVAAGGILTWADGDREPKSLEIATLADAETEGTELVDLVLRDPTGGATLEPEGSAVAAVLDAGGEPGCNPGPEALCLDGRRFRVEVEWQDPRSGNTGRGGTLPGTDDTGMLWFFDPRNTELIVKVLDGRPVNGAHWVFYGGLSDVEYWLVVTDTATGTARGYHNPPYHLCGDADTAAFPEPAGTAWAPPASAAFAATLDAPPAADASGTCQPSAEALCLLDGRFRVEVAWHDPRSGTTGRGQAMPGEDPTGTFWFFHPANLELVVKALDGRPVNGKLWFFYGALSTVEYTIKVTDTVTGAVREYDNAAGNLCGGADTAAFE